MKTIACKYDRPAYHRISNYENNYFNFCGQAAFFGYSCRLRSCSDEKLIAVRQAIQTMYDDEPETFVSAIDFELYRRGLVDDYSISECINRYHNDTTLDPEA